MLKIPALCPIALAALAGGTARAADLSRSVPGSSLEIDDVCARHVAIHTGSGPDAAVRVAATAADRREIDALQIGGGEVASIKRAPNTCPADRQPTLTLDVTVPEHFPVTITEGGVADYAVGPVGRLVAEFSGASKLDVADAADLSLTLSGTSRTSVGHAGGTAQLELSGDAEFEAHALSLTRTTLKLSGAGHVALDAGQVGDLTVRSSGAGVIDIRAEATTASLEASGAGRITLARSTGQVSQRMTGAATIRVGS